MIKTFLPQTKTVLIKWWRGLWWRQPIGLAGVHVNHCICMSTTNRLFHATHWGVSVEKSDRSRRGNPDTCSSRKPMLPPGGGAKGRDSGTGTEAGSRAHRQARLVWAESEDDPGPLPVTPPEAEREESQCFGLPFARPPTSSKPTREPAAKCIRFRLLLLQRIGTDIRRTMTRIYYLAVRKWGRPEWVSLGWIWVSAGLAPPGGSRGDSVSSLFQF